MKQENNERFSKQHSDLLSELIGNYDIYIFDVKKDNIRYSFVSFNYKEKLDEYFDGMFDFDDIAFILGNFNHDEGLSKDYIIKHLKYLKKTGWEFEYNKPTNEQMLSIKDSLKVLIHSGYNDSDMQSQQVILYYMLTELLLSKYE